MYVDYASGAYLYVYADKSMEYTTVDGDEFKYNPST